MGRIDQDTARFVYPGASQRNMTCILVYALP
jgi:hypothetical protein